jgi:hypothetical protein
MSASAGATRIDCGWSNARSSSGSVSGTTPATGSKARGTCEMVEVAAGSASAVLALALALADAASGRRKTRRSGLGGHGRAMTPRHRRIMVMTIAMTIALIASRAYSSACPTTTMTATTTSRSMMSISTLVVVATAIMAGNEMIVIANALVVAGNEVETAIGIEVGIPEVEAVVMTTEMGPGYAFAGLPTEPESTIRATLIRVRTTARAADGMKSRGTVIAGGKVAEAGIVGTSPGQTETMTGYREVRNTKEGMHDGFSTSYLRFFFSSFERSRINLTTSRVLDLSNFWYMETLHYMTTRISPRKRPLT